MEIIQQLINYVLHVDQHLIAFVNAYGNWTYALLFAIIFCETGLVIMPFLPGDSLLFASGVIAANTTDSLDINILCILLIFASFIGNGLNYLIGRMIGPKIFYSNQSWFFNKNYLIKAHEFYARYGGKTIILARFIPIIRTFAPFVAGIGYMSYKQFLLYNLAGAILWIGGLLYISYFFGNIPIVKENFSLVVVAIIAISILPPIVEILRRRGSSLF